VGEPAAHGPRAGPIFALIDAGIGFLSEIVTSERRGDLRQGVLPLLLRRVHLLQSTALLHIRRRGERGSFCFVNGQLAWGETNLEECRMGDCLVRHGRLTEGDYFRASLLVGEGQRLGQVLLELGLLDEQGRVEGLILHARDILMTVVSWSDGTWELEEPLPASVRGYSTPLQLSAAELILDAVWGLPDPSAVSAALGDLTRPLGMSTDERLRVPPVSLTVEDGFILSRVDGVTTANEVLDISGLERTEAERRLLALVCIGVIDYEAPKTRQSAPVRHTQEPVARPADPADPYAQEHVVPVIRLSLGPETAPVPEAETAPAEGKPGLGAGLLRLRGLVQEPAQRKQVEQELRAILAEDPGCADAFHLLGLLAREQKAEQRAQSYFRKAVELDPQHAAAADITTGAEPAPAAPGFFRKLLAR
jgi:hypothetical protein